MAMSKKTGHRGWGSFRGRRRALTAATLALASGTLVWAGVTLAAAPKPGGQYKGTIAGTQTTLEKRVSLSVSKDGKHGRVTWYCGTGRAPSSLPLTVQAGNFKVVKRVGTLTVWKFQGRFTSASRARALLDPKLTCDSRRGSVVLELVAR